MSSNTLLDREGGFTLMETIAALVIFSVVFFALYKGMAGSWRGARLAQTEQSALQLCRAKLAAVGIEIPLSDGLDVAADEDGFEWHVAVQKYAAPGDESQQLGQAAYWVTVEVEWRDTVFGSPRKIELKALKLART